MSAPAYELYLPIRRKRNLLTWATGGSLLTGFPDRRTPIVALLYAIATGDDEAKSAAINTLCQWRPTLEHPNRETYLPVNLADPYVKRIVPSERRSSAALDNYNDWLRAEVFPDAMWIALGDLQARESLRVDHRWVKEPDGKKAFTPLVERDLSGFTEKLKLKTLKIAGDIVLDRRDGAGPPTESKRGESAVEISYDVTRDAGRSTYIESRRARPTVDFHGQYEGGDLVDGDTREQLGRFAPHGLPPEPVENREMSSGCAPDITTTSDEQGEWVRRRLEADEAEEAEERARAELAKQHVARMWAACTSSQKATLHAKLQSWSASQYAEHDGITVAAAEKRLERFEKQMRDKLGPAFEKSVG